jgi:acid stress-induced BolA-like protein IbaG/YrbA
VCEGKQSNNDNDKEGDGVVFVLVVVSDELSDEERLNSC